MLGVDLWLILFIAFYGAFSLLCIFVGLKKIFKKKQKRPNLILIKGGKKDKGPYGKSR